MPFKILRLKPFRRKRGASLPSWAVHMQPLDMAGAALVLGISRRTLVELLKTLPHFELRGTRKVFYPEHIEALREGIRRCQGSKQSDVTASSTPSAPLPGSAFERALALVTRRLAEELRAQYEAKLWKRRSYGEEAVRTFEEAVMSYVEAGGERTYLEPLVRRFRGRVLGTIKPEEIRQVGPFAWPAQEGLDPKPASDRPGMRCHKSCRRSRLVSQDQRGALSGGEAKARDGRPVMDRCFSCAGRPRWASASRRGNAVHVADRNAGIGNRSRASRATSIFEAASYSLSKPKPRSGSVVTFPTN